MSNYRRGLATEIGIRDEQELRELQAASKQRVESLEKAVKKADDEYRYEEAMITRRRLRLWRGEEGEPGILDRIDDQMSLYEPAFSDDGREPDGQRSIFEGVDRDTAETEEPAPTPVVNIQALKALLIRTDLSGEVGAGAFDELDGEVEEHLTRAYLGRAPLELLHELPAVDAFALYQLAELGHAGKEEEAAALETDDAKVLFGKVATLIAQHGATVAPYHEPTPIVQDSEESELYDVERDFTDEEFFGMTDRQLEAVYQRALAAAAEAQEEPVELSDAEKEQEGILIHEPATGQAFRTCVGFASARACNGALEIVEGLEGNKVREAAIRKRLAVLEGSPEGEYDLTLARKKAIEVMAAAHDHSADVSNRTAAEEFEAEKAATITRKVAEWLVAEKLAEGVSDHDAVYLTQAGRELAERLGFGLAEIDEPQEEGVVEPTENEVGAQEEAEEEEGAVPVGVGASSALDGVDDLI